jgi:hypothetical protein
MAKGMRPALPGGVDAGFGQPSGDDGIETRAPTERLDGGLRPEKDLPRLCGGASVAEVREDRVAHRHEQGEDQGTSTLALAYTQAVMF